MTKEGLIAFARHKIKQESQEKHFSDKTVMFLKKSNEIKCERYESKIKKLENENDELKHKLKQAIKLLMLSKKECIYNGDEFQTEYRIKCNDFIAEIKHYLDEMEENK